VLLGLLGAGVTELLGDRIPELLDRVDLVELVARLGGIEAKRSGMGVTFHCPHPGHEDRSPSFVVKDGRWNCWSACARGGDALDLVTWLKGLTTAEAIEELAAGVGLGRPPAAERPTAAPSSALDREILSRWCAGRGWGAHVIAELGLSAVADKFGRRRIRFPFRLEGQTPYFQDRAVEEGARRKWLSPAGSAPVLYEADRLRLAEDRGQVFIAEGVTDVVALVDTYSSPAVVGIPGVSAWRSQWAQAFVGLEVWILADNDEAGGQLRLRLSGDLAGVVRAVWQVLVPEEHNDVSAWRQGLDPEAFDLQLMAAVGSAGRTA
jgi:DNA primase